MPNEDSDVRRVTFRTTVTVKLFDRIAAHSSGKSNSTCNSKGSNLAEWKTPSVVITDPWSRCTCGLCQWRSLTSRLGSLTAP